MSKTERWTETEFLDFNLPSTGSPEDKKQTDRQTESSWILNGSPQDERDRQTPGRDRQTGTEFLEFNIPSTAQGHLRTRDPESSWILMSHQMHRVTSGRQTNRHQTLRERKTKTRDREQNQKTGTYNPDDNLQHGNLVIWSTFRFYCTSSLHTACIHINIHVSFQTPVPGGKIRVHGPHLPYR